MVYVNWYEYMKNPYIDQKSNTIDKVEGRKWEDLITGNIFYINESNNFQIENFASQYIVELLENKNYNELFSYLRLDNKDLRYNLNDIRAYELWLFPQLPFLINKNYINNDKAIVSPRIMDYLSMRTGLLYAVASSNNKDEIRLISYLTGILPYVNNHAKEVIENIINDEKYNNYKNMLKEIDEISYVRFASVYRQFKDINTFLEEITRLMIK